MIRIQGVQGMTLGASGDFARDWAQRAEADARVPEGEGTDRFNGYSVMGLTFHSGHVLALASPGRTTGWQP